MGTGNGTPDVAHIELKLSEQSDVIRAQQEELDRVHADLHRRNVDDRISGWSSKGLNRLPGVLKTARRIMLEDDGGPALVMHLSEEEGNGQREMTASGIVEMLIESLPLSEDGSEFALSGQVFAPDTKLADATKPPQHLALSQGEFDNSLDAVRSRAAEAAEELALPKGRIPSGGDN